MDGVRRPGCRAVGALIGAVLCLSGPAGPRKAAADILPSPLAGWSLYVPEGRKPALFEDRGEAGLGVRTQKGVGFLFRPVRDRLYNVEKLSWDWRVDIAAAMTPLGLKAQDDRSIAVHLWFPPAGGLRRLEAAFARLAGLPPVGRMLTYVWGGTEAEGAMLPNPYYDQGRVIVLRSGREATGAWRTETVDFRADFSRAFGGTAPDPVYIAVSADTDDAGGESDAAIRLELFR